MKWIGLLWRVGVILGVALGLSGAMRSASADRPPKPPTDLRQHPTGGKTPITVAVGIYLTNLVAIDESRETFEVTGYLFGKWRDPRFADANTESASRKFKLDELWSPAIDGENSVSHKTNSYDLEVDPNGWVTYTENFDGTLSTAYNLRAFPFDTQVLRFEYQPFLAEGSEFEFAQDPLPATAISRGKYTQLAAWEVKDLKYSTEKIQDPVTGHQADRAIFEVVVMRRWGFYVWKVFLPLLIMTLLPAVVFWIDVKEFDWMLKIPMTMLLATVAFEFVVSRDLPKIGYLTLLDAVFLLSLVFYSICSVEITAVFLMQRSGRRPEAERLHVMGRWAYPAAYLAMLALFAAYFLK